MDAKFKPGDLVRLRSSGPAMTVWSIRNDGLYEVVWFRDDVAIRDSFAEVELVPANPPRPVPWSEVPWSERVTITNSPRPVPWLNVKRDFDDLAKSIQAATTPGELYACFVHIDPMLRELRLLVKGNP